MKTGPRSRRVPMIAGATLAFLALIAPAGAHAVDAAAAEGLARQSGCLKCHAVDKKKVGPSFKEAAAKYKADKDAVAKLQKHLTGEGRMKTESGKEEAHPAVKSKKADDIRNLVDWILSV